MSRGDIDWGQGTLTIRESRSHKSRLVPLHSSVVQALREYAQLRDRCHPIAQTDVFFVSDRGFPLPYVTVRSITAKTPRARRKSKSPSYGSFSA